MDRIKTLETRSLCESAKNGGCGECQTSCQSACIAENAVRAGKAPAGRRLRP